MKISSLYKDNLERYDKITEFANSRNFIIIALVLIAIISIIVYSNIYGNSTHFDDEFIIKNTALHNPNDFDALFSINKFRVVPFWTFAVNYTSSNSGNNLDSFYTTNIIIHIINSFLVFGICLMIFKTPVIKDKPIASYSGLIAFFVALMFAVHPIQTQAVTYIYQRLASIAATFYYGAIFWYLLGRISTRNFMIKILFYIMSLIFLMLGLFSKENVFTIFPMILLIELILFNKNFKLSPIIIAIFIVLTSVGFYIFTQFQLPSNIIGTLENFNGETITSSNYLITQFKVLPIYLKLFLVPLGQNFDHDVRISDSFMDFEVIIGLIIIASVILYGLIMYRFNRIITFGIIWFFLTIAIESSVIPIADVIFEHRVYLPMFGLLIAFVATLFEIFSRKPKLLPVMFVLLLIIVTTNATLAYQRNFVWRSEKTLWTDAVNKSPFKARTFFKRGQANIADNQINYAFYDFSRTIELRPEFLSAYTYRAAISVSMNKFKDAIEDYDKFIELSKNKSQGYLNKAIVYAKMKRYNKSLKEYTNYLKINNQDVGIIIEKASIYEKINDATNAIKTVQEALKIDSTNTNAMFALGRYLYLTAKFDAALEWIDKVINSSKANNDILLNSYNIKGSIFFFKKNYKEALKQYHKASEINNSYQPLLINLALLHRTLGDYNKELEVINLSIASNGNNYDSRLARGVCNVNLKKYKDAENDFKSAIEIDKTNDLAKRKLGEIQRYLK